MAHSDINEPTDSLAREERLRLAERLPEDGIIERIEERAVIGKRVVDAGGIRVSTRTETHQDVVRDTLEGVAVEVERVPVGRFVDAAEAPRVEGDVTILPVYEERLVVEKRLYLVEEVHVRRQARNHEVEVPVELRRQALDVERLPPLGESGSPDTHLGVNTMMDDTYSGTRTVTAMFDNSAEAERAASRLRSAGIPDSQIRVTQGSSQSYSGTVDYNDTTYRDQHKGFWDSLGDFFFPEEDRYAYAEGLARGSQMVTVTGFESSMYDTVVDILDDEGSVDLDTRESEWQSSGWSGYRGSSYADPNDISGTGGMAGGTSGLGGAAAGIGSTIGNAVDRAGDALSRGADRVGDALTGDSNTRGTIYDDGMQDRNLQMAADTGRRSQADLGSQQQGFASSGSMSQSTGLGTTGYRDTSAADFEAEGYNEDGTVKVVEERLNVGKREVEGGRVRVRSYVREEPVSADVDLRSTRVYLERRPVDRAVTAGDMDLGDRTLEARETREEAVVGKEARVVEEIGLRKETEVEHQRIQDTVRKTEVEIEDERTGDRTRLSGDDTTGGSGRF
ncbi:MAG TPA: YsnF/AvaK domain-containing protein [Rubellimicrobium sp.]|nr:YsnF/AvaK domain-containing protein [Rubellimicrobium sp.]